MGAFGGYTRWAVVFLIIFVLFFLLCPAGAYAAPAGGVAVTGYEQTTYEMGSTMMGPGYSAYGTGYDMDESESS